MLVVYKLKPQVASNERCCTLVRLGSVPPADPGPSTSQSLQGVLIPDSVKTGATSFKRVGPPVKFQAPGVKLIIYLTINLGYCRMYLESEDTYESKKLSGNN